jgi:hypothetical protein
MNARNGASPAPALRGDIGQQIVDKADKHEVRRQKIARI